MTKQTPTQHSLYQAIEHCLLKDKYPLRRTVQQWQSMPAGEKKDALLAKIIKRIDRSQAFCQQRNQPVTLSYSEDLPVSEKRNDILSAIKNNQVVVVAGATGSGKTTQLPKICLEAGFGVKGLIGHTQPRRLAARAVAQRIAEELNSPLGDLVGYQVRFTDQSSEQSRIKVMTDGILLAQTQHDKFLNEYDCIIIDEAHERSLNIDFLLGYLKQLLAKRKDLKVIITSATIDVERFSQHFNNAPVIEVSGRTYPVEVRYRPLLSDAEDEDDLTQFEGISQALAELREEDRQQKQIGDVLVFLSGEREIRECADFLRKENLPSTQILPLYARLGASEQQKIFHPQGGRRVILATNVAETSLTVPGIRYVVDAGTARISRYSYRSKVQRLPIEAISQASANQRAGRCGRTAPGVCIRLYSEEDFLNRPEFTEPEIQRTNLASVILQLLHLRLGKLQDFPFIDVPDDRFVKDGLTLLQELDAVNDKGELLPRGKQMASLPVDPRIGRILLEASQRGALKEVLIIAAVLSGQDPHERPAEKQQAAAEKHRLWRNEESDFLTFVNLWELAEEQRQDLGSSQYRKWCTKHFLSFMRLREWRETHRQLLLLCKGIGLALNKEPSSYEAVHKSLLSGMLSQVGFKIEGQEYLGARNRKFLIYPGSGLAKKRPKWIMAAELVETSKLFARTVALIQPEWLEELGKPLLKYQYFEPHWEKQRGQVVTYEQSSLYGLVVNPRKRVNFANIEPETARTIFIQEALVAQQFNSKVGFYQHNITLLEEVTEYEEKSRRRDLVIDDNWQANFYDQHLPKQFISQRHLESWYKKATAKQKQALEFTREQLLSDEAAGIGVGDFPTELEWQGMAFPLSYTFAPNAIDDGVSLTVPVAMLSQVPEAQIEWLVPGFIQDKVEAILRGLPKAVRKQFVPVPNTAKEFLRQSNPNKSGLYTQLLAFINNKVHPPIELTDLYAIELTPHFLMNIKVLQDGEEIAQSRDLSALKEKWGAEGQEQVMALTHQGFQRADISSWDFGDLPDSIQTTSEGLPIKAYPCLKVSNKQIELTVEAKQESAQQSHREGLLWLMRKALPEQERMLKSIIQKALANYWLLARGLANQNDITDDLIAAVFTHVLLPLDEPLPRLESDYNNRLERRSELIAFGETLIQEYIQWLKIRHDILKQLKGSVSIDRAMACSDAKAHLERLFKQGFMQAMPWQQLKQYARYLKAIAYRLDKLQGNLARDRQSMIEFDSLWQPYQAKLEQPGMAINVDLVEFGYLLEEWRVGLFAQPLGTSEPVSLKRLQKRWQEISSA